jgi:hypothetical protein
MKTRRQFLGQTPAFLLLATLAPTALASSNGLAGNRMRPVRVVSLDQMNCATFVPLLNSSFKCKPAGVSDRDLILAGIEEQPLTAISERASLETFSLLFWSRSDVKLPQGTYSLEHPALGEFALFIVPVDRANPGQLYEAVFNRIL